MSPSHCIEQKKIQTKMCHQMELLYLFRWGSMQLVLISYQLRRVL